VGMCADHTKNHFALRQLNASIRSINKTNERALWWRAVVVSTIFTNIFVFQKEYTQAAQHFFSGQSILRENSPDSDSGSPDSLVQRHAPVLPISLDTVRSLMTDVVARGDQFDIRDFRDTPPLLPADSVVTLWEKYTCPPGTLPAKMVELIPHVRRATKTSESLFWALHFYSMRRTKSLKGLFVKRGPESLGDFGVEQEQYARSYCEIAKAVANFERHKEIRCGQPKIMTKERTQLKKSWLSLQLLHASCKALFLQDPDLPHYNRRQVYFAELYDTIVNLSEQIIKMEKNSSAVRSPNPTVSNPLFLVVRSAYDLNVRRRAMELLKQPTVESLWDSRIGALFSAEIMERERFMTVEYDRREEDKSVVVDDFTSRGREVEVRNESDVHPLARICSFKWEKRKENEVRLKLFTWREWLYNERGKTIDIGW
jgi:hypothetical protein